MGHIANKIDAEDKKLSEVLSGKRYRIDAFQREYRWQRKQIEALISDLSLSFLKSYKEDDKIEDYTEYDCYYMGPIVLCEEKTELSIVDGQQRLTSFTLLLIYLLHAQDKLEIPKEIKKDFTQYLYVSKAGKKTLVLNVDKRNNVINHLIANPDILYNSEDSPLEPTDNSLGNIPDESIINILSRYEDIETFFPIEINNPNTLPIFIEWLLDKVVLVEVKAYSMENAYSIFETMNDRGLTLNPSEILKGYLLSQINDDEKSEEANEFWRKRVAEIKNVTASENSDIDFFRAWFRAKYAVTKRKSGKDSTNEDFELIGTNFHNWIKNNREKVYLKTSDDFYFFIKSDFDFYSDLYLKLFELKNYAIEEFDDIYISSFYPIADSLFYPLMMSSVSKIDDLDKIDEKIKLVGKFVDVYINSRTLTGKSITQTGIRNSIYDLVRNIRDVNFFELRPFLQELLEDIDNIPVLFLMNNWGYYHYFFSRIIYHFDDSEDFLELQRSRKQRSYILVRIFGKEEMSDNYEESRLQSFMNSAANYCLIRRYDSEEVSKRKGLRKMKYLQKQNYLPEMSKYTFDEHWSIGDFIGSRDAKLREVISEIWEF
jgi:uncharacterized protein with ParB-like and HNH nuclease domain